MPSAGNETDDETGNETDTETDDETGNESDIESDTESDHVAEPGDPGQADLEAPDRSLSARIERSDVGQLAIGILIVVLLVGQVATHLPSSAMARATRQPADQALRVLGSEQSWGVFSPDPRRTSLGLEGRITFADGSTAVWHVPDGAPVGANLRFYRWRKWLERVRSDSARGLWAPTARWLADEHRDGPSPPVRVELVRRFRDNRVQGPQPPWQERVYHVLELDPDGTPRTGGTGRTEGTEPTQDETGGSG